MAYYRRPFRRYGNYRRPFRSGYGRGFGRYRRGGYAAGRFRSKFNARSWFIKKDLATGDYFKAPRKGYLLYKVTTPAAPHHLNASIVVPAQNKMYTRRFTFVNFALILASGLPYRYNMGDSLRLARFKHCLAKPNEPNPYGYWGLPEEKMMAAAGLGAQPQASSGPTVNMAGT